METPRIIGDNAPRVEGAEKVSGRAVYAADVVLPGMLWAKVLRSPIASGRIKRIQVAAALRLPGVKAVITGADLSGIRVGKQIRDMPLLADGVVRFVGEKVAAVAAENEAIAEQALALIEVEYEDRTPLFDAAEAMRASSPVIHPDLAAYEGLLNPWDKPSNVFVVKSWQKGLVEKGFEQSDLVLENTFTTAMVHQAYIEPHACVVRAAPAGSAEIWASTKSPFGLRIHVGRAFQVAPEEVIVHPCFIGGDFGGKGDPNDIALCYAFAKKTGRPVKMVMDYAEEFLAGNPRHAATVRIKSGVRKEGRLVAQHMEFVFDSGAYGAFRPQGLLVGAHTAAGPYRIPHVLVEEKYVYTNKVPCGYMRAPGHLQGFFASECQMDLLAEALAMDPVRFRQINFMEDGDESPTEGVVSHIKAAETLERALREAGYRRPREKNTGRGFAVAQWLSKGGESNVFVKVEEDGQVTVLSAVIDVGPGVYTIMRMIAAEELGTRLGSVRVEPVDPARVAADSGVRGSSSTRNHGSAAYEAAVHAREEILEVAARAMGASREELILFDGGVTHRRAERRMTFAEIVKAKGAPILGEGHYRNMKDGPESSMVAQVAEVAVDPETGEVKIKQVTTAHNTGAILNPLTHQGQIDGGVVMGVGYAVMEEIRHEGGRVATANFGDYKIPTVRDIPVLKTALIPSNIGSGPYGSMSIGETPLIPTAAAVANALADAVGVRIRSLPITAEKVLEALKSNRR
ncbi:MAG TPA: xanthine dehydrogenase family protein molybdopterin-binding subunit [Candidatus Binatia bacterium]